MRVAYLVFICFTYTCYVHGHAPSPASASSRTPGATRRETLLELAAHRMTVQWHLSDNPGHAEIHFSKQYWPLDVLVDIANATTLGCGGTITVYDYTCPYTDEEWAQGEWRAGMVSEGDVIGYRTEWSLERPNDWLFPAHDTNTWYTVSAPSDPPARYPDYYRVVIHIDFDMCRDGTGYKNE